MPRRTASACPNRGCRWTDGDLRALSDLVRNRTAVSEICKTLGRSESAVRHALTKVLFRGLLRHPADDLFEFYHICPEGAGDYLVAEKYDLIQEEPRVGERSEAAAEGLCLTSIGFLAGALAMAAAGHWLLMGADVFA